MGKWCPLRSTSILWCPLRSISILGLRMMSYVVEWYSSLLMRALLTAEFRATPKNKT